MTLFAPRDHRVFLAAVALGLLNGAVHVDPLAPFDFEVK
jgi:hypothetical protein